MSINSINRITTYLNTGKLQLLDLTIRNYFVFFAILLFLNLSSSGNAATFTVINTNDSGAGSLRQAILDANTTSDEDIINFDPTVFSTPKTIILTTGELYVFYSITINGPGVNLLTISGNNQSRIFFNNFSNSTLNINNLTLTQGFAANGGAIYVGNFLKLTNLVITGNKAAGALESPGGFYAGLGGAIYSTSSLTLTNSILSNNMASGVVRPNTTNPNFGDSGTAGGGGAIFASGSNNVTVNCKFSDNTAQGITSPTAGEGRSGSQGGSAYGGAIYGFFSIDIINSTFINNKAVAGDGGSIISSSFGLSAGSGGEALGGAVFSRGSRILNSSFITNLVMGGNGGAAPNPNATGNAFDSLGGGIHDIDPKIANTTVVNNSVVAGTGRNGGNGLGGGIFGGSNQWSIRNSTITGNTVAGGGGTEANGLLQGGGVYSRQETGQASSFQNNIVAENSAATGTDVFGNFINASNNLIRIGEGSSGITNNVNGNIVGTISSPINPLLAPLADNGGLTQTRALLEGSPAINAGNNALTINPFNSQILQFDQRNFQRIFPVGATVDIGAFEFGSLNMPVPAAPDLQSASDTGVSNTDNITRATMPVFDVLNVIPGSKVELLRNNVVVSSINAVLFSVTIVDPNPPPDAIVQYTARQIINEVISSTSPVLNVTFDNTAPTVIIDKAIDQADPTTNLPIRFTAQFSEPVLGFDRDDIFLTGSTADVSTAFIFVNSTSPSSYTIEISGIRSPGEIIVTIPAGAAYDRVLINSTEPTYIDNSVNFQPGVLPVNVSGRIRKISGLIKSPSSVVLTDNFTGESWTTRTNYFGFYRFSNLPVYQQIGRRFTVRVNNKGFIHNVTQPVTITNNVNNLNINIP